MERAVMLAKVQQQLAERTKSKFPRGPFTNRQGSSTVRPDQKLVPAPSTLSKERQKREFCKANNLCY
jgi:hypothetical protein